MLFRLIGIGMTLFVINRATGVGEEQLTYLSNIVKITLVQHEVDSIAHTVYSDKVLSNDNELPYLSEDEWAEYIRLQMQSKSTARDTSKDLWVNPYQVCEADPVPGRSVRGFTVRSAGPDKSFETKDDVISGYAYK